MIDSFFKNIFFFVWPVCRMKCKYCLENSTNNYELFDDANIIKLLDIFGKYKVKKLWLTGGDVTLCPYILDYIDMCKKYEIKPFFSTQDGKALSKLIENLNDIDIQLSLNGLYEDHDEITCVNGSFIDIEKAVEEINKSKKNIRLSARFILRLKTKEKVEEYIDWCTKHDIKDIYFSNISSAGKGESYIKENGKITKEEFNNIVNRLTKKYKDLHIEGKSNGKQGDLCGVYPNGNLYIRPVDNMPVGRILLGNLFEQEAQDIYNNFKYNYPELYKNYKEKIDKEMI